MALDSKQCVQSILPLFLQHNQSLGRLVSYDGGQTLCWKEGLKSPLQRVEVSPDSSPEIFRAHVGLRTQRRGLGTSWANGSFTIPSTRPSVMDHRPRTLAPSSHRYAQSEVVRGTRSYNTFHGAVNRPANQPMSRTRPRPAMAHNDFLLHRTPYQTAETQQVAVGSYRTQRQEGGLSAAGGKETGSLPRLSQVVRTDSQRSDRQRRGSSPPSVASMELDTSVKKTAAGQLSQQTAVSEQQVQQATVRQETTER